MNRVYLVDPVLLGEGPGLDLLGLEPEGNLLLGVLDSVGTVADVAADVLKSIMSASTFGRSVVLWALTYNGVVTTDGARGGGKRVGGTEDGTAGLDGVTALPDHGADWAATHVYAGC